MHNCEWLDGSHTKNEVPMDEKKTRQEIIDRDLWLAGWNVKDPSHVTEELDIDLVAAGHARVAESRAPYGGHQFADYGLLMGHKPVAVVEAKKTSKDAELGQEQALQYAQNLQKIHDGAMPFVFYSNGYDTYFWESEFYPPSKVHGFPTREDIQWMAQRRETRKPLSVELINTDIAGRDYQIAAIRTLLEAVEAKKRKFLLVMATGVGKTRTAAAFMDVLLRAHWAKRVLFLVDRIPLRDQALNAFKEHLPSEPRWPEQGEKAFAPNRRIYVSTYPTMLNMIERGTTPETRISPFFFDLIIADESHRSIYNVYQQVVTYFHGLTLGLTATPRDHIDHDTFKIFNCDQHDPTFAYTYEEATNHTPPFLCDFEVLKVRSKFQLEGIKGGTLPPAVQKKLIAEGKDVENIDFEGTDLERKVTNAGTNALIVREFMEESIKDSNGTLPGKTIFFAISKAHARRLQALFDDMYPEYKGKLARVLVSEDSRVYGKGGLLDQFTNADMPRVAISVDLLDTGVDVREITNLVFAKPVYSYVKFWQMIGRGTRVLDPDRIRSWCPEKDKFLIIDCWGNFEYFKMHPKGREPGAQEPLPVRLFRARLDKLEAAIAANRPDIITGTVATLRADIADLPDNNVVVHEKQADLDTVAPGGYWGALTAEHLAFLRTTIAPIMRVRAGIDFKAMRFETEVVELGTALLSDNKDMFLAIQASLREQVSELPLTVNLVKKHESLISDVLTNAWWKTPTEEKLQSLVTHLAPLMKFRTAPSGPIEILDIEDLVAIKEHIDFGPEHERMTTSAYRERVEGAVRALVDDNPLLQKMLDGEELSEAEIAQLAELLEHDSLQITEDRLRQAYNHKRAHFIQFIKHILGLEPLADWEESVAQAFAQFITTHTTLTSLQIQFLRTLETFIIQTGKVDKPDLIDAPFTLIHPQGIRGVFQPAEIDEIMAFTGQLVA